MTTQAEKAKAFAALHEQGAPFVIPNPWDAGSALLLQDAGFKALATTSAGFAWALGRKDGQVSLDEKLQHCSDLCAATDIPINADFENGFADAPKDAAANLLRVAEAGVVGASIEDWSGTEIYDFDDAVKRVEACAKAKAALGFPFMLTARAEGLLRQVSDLAECIKRLKAFEAAGADVLYVPGLKSLDQVAEVRAAVSKPINVLVAFMPKTAVDDYAQFGACRLSVGGALAAHAIGATRTAADKMAEGSFSWG